MQQVLARIQNRLARFTDDCEQRELQLQREAEEEKQRKEAYRQVRLEFQKIFEKTILRDIKELVAQLEVMFKEHNLLLKCESHKYYNYFRPLTNPIEPYIVLAVERKDPFLPFGSPEIFPGLPKGDNQTKQRGNKK